jgi:hypothetical protein
MAIFSNRIIGDKDLFSGFRVGLCSLTELLDKLLVSMSQTTKSKFLIVLGCILSNTSIPAWPQ